MVYILITISLDNLVESPCFVCWSYCCLMGISQISKGSRKIEYPRSVCNFILINMWHNHQAKLQQTKIPVTKIQLFAQSSILFRDTGTDFCQARPIVNKKALLICLENPDQNWVWPGWPVLASLLLAPYSCNGLINFTVHTFPPKLSLLYFCHQGCQCH